MITRRGSLFILSVGVLALVVIAVVVYKRSSSGSNSLSSKLSNATIQSVNRKADKDAPNPITQSHSFLIKEISALSCDSVAISWRTIGALNVTYEITRLDASSGESEIITTIAQSDHSRCSEMFCSFTDATMKPRTAYTYTIRAQGIGWSSVNGSGLASKSACDPSRSSACPVEIQTPACELVRIRQVGDACKSVQISWDPLLETSSYRIYRSTLEQEGSEYISETRETRYEDANIVVDHEYLYSVSPVYAWGEEGNRSEPLSVKTVCPGRKWEER